VVTGEKNYFQDMTESLFKSDNFCRIYSDLYFGASSTGPQCISD